MDQKNENEVETPIDCQLWSDLDNLVFSWSMDKYLSKPHPTVSESKTFYEALFKNAGLNQCCTWVKNGVSIDQIRNFIEKFRNDQLSWKNAPQDREHFAHGLEFILKCHEADVQRIKKLVG